MKLATTLIIAFWSIWLTAQADIPQGWNWTVNESGKISIHHTNKTDDYTVNFTVIYNDIQYNTHIDVAAGEWGAVNFPEDFDFTYENMPDGSGTIQARLIIEVEEELVGDEYYQLTARNANQPYEVKVSEIEDRINFYGSTVDDCIFWKDHAGYNYIIRSHNEGKPGIFMSHWVMDVRGTTELINQYKNDSECMADRTQNQYHSLGWKLEDENEDGYMEFYSLIFDACEKSRNHPQHATLLVYTNVSDLYLMGRSYSLIDNTDDVGGSYEASEELKEYPEIMESAEEAWEVYIME
ncbi:hypothetical protein [Parvicella tangerina]|uniref:DUF695 domain-containing protein n=1 Tax=Parvicella tangerina TaxID=2829795 RepID=A0A916JMG1_9FLAO|nr:hypothetical protein [Parvicella tangerina]CAG5081673.1 hypothetical protein CRYO30217_01699 [Parvicella tangerina]